jgi:hypothetical protein
VNDSKKRRVQLSEDDRARMARLYEETTVRLTEMAMIVARNLGLDPDKHAPVFERARDADRAMTHMSIDPGVPVRLVSNSNRTSNGCYLYRESVAVACDELR